MLEKELAYLGSVCAAALMKKDLALPIGMNITNRWITNGADMYFIYSYNPQWLRNFKHRQTKNLILSIYIQGNELEEDLEILEEASLQVTWPKT